MGCREGSSKRKVYSNKGLFKEERTIPNEQSKFTVSETGKRRTKRPKVSRRRDIIKIREDINKTENSKIIEKITETKSWFLEKINKIDKPESDLSRKKENIQA